MYSRALIETTLVMLTVGSNSIFCYSSGALLGTCFCASWCPAAGQHL